MDVFSLVLVVAVVGAWAVLLVYWFTPAGKRNRERQKQAQREAGEKRLETLSKAGIVPVEPKQKISSMISFAIAVTALSVLLTWAMLDSFFFGNEGFLIFGSVFGAVFGFFFSYLAVAVANKAEEAGRSWMSFFWLSLLISPLITWLIAATLKPAGALESSPAFAESRGDSLERKLTELQSLKDKGILSQDEFEEAKRKALGI